MASEKLSINLDKLGTVMKKNGKVYVELGSDVEVFEGKKGNYINAVRWENETPNQFGQTSSFQISQPKGSDAPKRYFGNGSPLQSGGNAPAPASSVADASGGNSDLPF